MVTTLLIALVLSPLVVAAVIGVVRSAGMPPLGEDDL